VRLEIGEQARQVVGLALIEAGLGAAAAVVVLADEDAGVLEDHLVSGGRHHLERHAGEQRPQVVPVEVDLEDAADMRLVVRVIVERHAVDLDRAVVPRRPATLQGARLAGDGRHEADDPDQHRHDAAERLPLPLVIDLLLSHALVSLSSYGASSPLVAQRRGGSGCGRPLLRPPALSPRRRGGIRPSGKTSAGRRRGATAQRSVSEGL
jgi:hypothetical protein